MSDDDAPNAAKTSAGGAPAPDLAARIAAAQDKTKPTPGPNYAAKYNALSLAWRMTLELVVGSAIGFAIGFGLDALIGTAPLFLIVFGLLGFAAGVRVVMATAQEASRPEPRSDAEAPQDGRDGPR